MLPPLEMIRICLFLLVPCAGIVEPASVVDNGDQTHTVSYVPTKEGPYSINVLYADEEIPRRYYIQHSDYSTFNTLFRPVSSP